MIKTILWDFDGVIIDSMKIKGNGFIELFNGYNKKNLKLIEEYHYKNGGISRFDKIKYFYNNILKENISEKMIIKLADKFAVIIEKKLYDKNNLIQDTIDFIKNNQKKYNFHIVSGAEHIELNKLCINFELTEYFISIDGSPIKKDILIKNIMKKFEYLTEETILIGDSINDYNAAKKNDVVFYGYNNTNLKNHNYINNFNEFKL